MYSQLPVQKSSSIKTLFKELGTTKQTLCTTLQQISTA